MKITQIQINGIRGFSFNYDTILDQENPHCIELQNGNSFLLYGENGTGKSSFFDALEWGLTGNIEEEAKQRRVEIRQFLKNSFSSDRDNPNVITTFKDNQIYQRKLIGSNHTFEFESIAPYHFIESNRISTFVTDTKSSLWKRFLDLIGLDDLLEVQQQLKYAKTEFNREFNPKNEELSSLKLEKKDIEEQLQNISNSLDNRFAEKWKETDHSNELQLQIERQVNLKALLEEITNIFPVIEKIEAVLIQKGTLEQKIANSKNKINLIEVAKILEQAERYFIENKTEKMCPVCNEQTINEDVILSVSMRKNELNDILNNEEQLKNISRELQNLEGNFKTQKSSILQKLKIIGYLLEENTIFNFDFFTKILEQFNSEFETLKSTLEIQNDIDFKEYNKKLVALKKLNIKVEIFEKELKLQSEAITDFEDYFTAFKKSYEDILTNELENISSQYVTEIYNKLNETDNEIRDSFKIVHNIEEQEIKFVAKHKYSNTEIDPINILSTAHLRCLGFALLMSRILKKNSTLKFIAIDDPIYAIDHEHRYSLINYLVLLSKKYQLIITTSDRNFYDIFRNKMGIQKLNVYETHLEKVNGNSVIPHLKILPRGICFISQAREHLTKRDYRSAALYTRLALENTLYEIAKNNSWKLNLIIGRHQNISLDDIFKCVQNGLKVKNTERESQIDKEFTNISNNEYFKSLLTSSPVNIELHQTVLHKDFLNTKSELEELINTTDKFIVFIKSF